MLDKFSSSAPKARDLNSGTYVSISDPAAYELTTEMINSGWYKKGNQEFRFSLVEAREAGLAIHKD